MTREEAKELYIKYDCSLFVMAREEEKYDEYRTLKISVEEEKKWIQEQLLISYEQIKTSGDSRIFNKMCSYFEKRKSLENIMMIEEALKYVKYEDPETKVSVVETILGKKDFSVRSGLVFGAYDLNDYEMAKRFLLFVKITLSNDFHQKDIAARVDRDIQRCYLLGKELLLDVGDGDF